MRTIFLLLLLRNQEPYVDASFRPNRIYSERVMTPPPLLDQNNLQDDNTSAVAVAAATETETPKEKVTEQIVLSKLAIAKWF